MAKQPDIRWRNKDVEELRIVLRNFNAKVRRVEKGKPQISEYQPETVKLSALRESITTRREFNNKIKELQRYSRRGAEKVVTGSKGLTLTVFEQNEVRILTRTVNRKLSMEAKRRGLTPERGTSAMIEEQNLRKKKFTIDKTETEWRKFKASLEKRLMEEDKEQKLQNYFNNYKETVTKFLGEEGDKLIDYLESKANDLETFFEQSLSDPVLSMGFISDPIEVSRIVEQALARWQSVFK